MAHACMHVGGVEAGLRAPRKEEAGQIGKGPVRTTLGGSRVCVGDTGVRLPQGKPQLGHPAAESP